MPAETKGARIDRLRQEVDSLKQKQSHVQKGDQRFGRIQDDIMRKQHQLSILEGKKRPNPDVRRERRVIGKREY